MNEFFDILGSLGLTEREAKVYSTLLRVKEARTGRLCKATGIASSNVYGILDSLLTKGLVSYRVQNNVKVFMPAPPDALNELFLIEKEKLDSKKKKLRELISELKGIENTREPYSNYKYYEGVAGVKSMWHDMNLETGKKSEFKMYSSKKEGFKKLVPFFNEQQKLREKKKVRARVIFSEDTGNLAKKRSNSLSKIKLLDLKTDAEWGVMDDMFYIHHIIGETPRAFLIKDKIFAETFTEVFERVWKQAKNIK